MLVSMAAKPVEVICYSGYAADEEPRAVVADGCRSEVVALERRWREPELRGFVVRMADGTRGVLRQSVATGAWKMTTMTTMTG
jgi:hypothetical protein